jgi:hypothetical protein
VSLTVFLGNWLIMWEWRSCEVYRSPVFTLGVAIERWPRGEDR